MFTKSARVRNHYLPLGIRDTHPVQKYKIESMYFTHKLQYQHLCGFYGLLTSLGQQGMLRLWLVSLIYKVGHEKNRELSLTFQSTIVA